jgi:RNA polymerase sigma-70 factor (ECF subfamily)
MSLRSVVAHEPAESSPAEVDPGVARERSARLGSIASEHFQFIWRSLRRLGVPPGAVDDAAQQVFEVAARRLDAIELGREKAFLFKTALFVATDARRKASRSRSRDGGDIEGLSSPAPSPEDSTLHGEKRLFLDRVLGAMEVDLRAVFVLYEIEELEMGEIADLLGVPRGTVASRLRRAREDFHAGVKRLRARLEFPGGQP